MRVRFSMFDVGFWELLLIGIIALLVVGPEKLPGLAHQVGFWVGRAKQMIHSVQSDLSAEIKKGQDIQHMVKNQLDIKELHETIELDQSKPTVAVPRSSKKVDDKTEDSQKNLATPTIHGQKEEKKSSRG